MMLDAEMFATITCQTNSMTLFHVTMNAANIVYVPGYLFRRIDLLSRNAELFV